MAFLEGNSRGAIKERAKAAGEKLAAAEDFLEIASCAFAALAGCTTVPAPVSNPRQIWCDQNGPRRDATTQTARAELDEINAHNFKGQLRCRWKA